MTISQTQNSARPLDAGAIAVIVLTCLVWGLNQVAVKFALPDVPPIIQLLVRSIGGLVIVLAWTWWRGVPLMRRDGTLVAGVFAGLLFSAEFILLFRGLAYTSASRASLFIYTAPFFVALGARWLLPGERLSAAQWLGLASCFAGIAAAVGIPQPNVAPSVLLGDAMIIVAGAFFGAITLVVKATSLRSVAPERTLAYQLVVSIPILTVASIAFGESMTRTPGAATLAWLAFQIGVVGVTFPIFFTLIQRYAATRVSAFTFLVPLFGIAAGCILLNEPFTPAFAAATALVVTGLVLVNRRA